MPAFSRARSVTSLSLALLPLLAGTAHGQIQWKSGAPAPVFNASPRALMDQAAAKASYLVVKLSAPITPAGRQQLLDSGLHLLSPLGDNSFFASLDPAAASAAIVNTGWLVGAAAIRPEWKLHRDLLAGETPSWTIVNQGPDPEVALYVSFFDDAPAPAVADAILKRHGGLVMDILASVNTVVVHLPRSRVAALAAEDQVQYIEPAIPLLTTCNAETRTMVGANTVNAAPYSLSGTGVKVLVFDGGGVRTTHVDLANRVTVIDGSTAASHATHVAGTIGGTGAAVLNNRGMAPGVTFLSARIDTAQSGWLYTNPADIELDYTNAYNQGAHLANNSIGTNVAPNFFPCSWEGDYNATDRVIDSIVRGSSPVTQNNPFRIVWAGGNERGSGRCGTTYNTIAPPAGAKNHLSCGSVDSDTEGVSSFSGWGPTDDGRMKPDFCAPGCQAGGDGGTLSCSNSTNSYTIMCGTSMATPTVAGCSALLLQDWRAIYTGQPDPRNSTLKVFFAQSAVDKGNVGPDYQFGYGSIRIPAAIDLMRTGNFRESSVAQGTDKLYNVVVPPGASTLKLTLAWDDVPGTANTIPELVNDLDLEVFSPTDIRAYPWTLNPAAPSTAAVRTARNFRDNLEQVLVNNPEAGTWRVRVRAFNVPTGPQPFSIVASGALTDALANDLCVSATPVSVGTTAFTTVGAATDGPQEPSCSFCCGDLQVNQDIWYSFTAPCTGTATITLCDLGVNYDSKVAIYSGGCPTQPGTAIACNDDSCDLVSSASWNATENTTYLIRIGGYESNSGSGSFNLSCSAGTACYANCDESTASPILNVADFTCFLQRFASGESYANCDGSTTEPILNVADFTCFLQQFAAGCP